MHTDGTCGRNDGNVARADVEWWIRTRLWDDRSGGFQIDGPGQLMIREIRGDWTSIVGLPVFLFGDLLRRAQAPYGAA